MSQYPQMSLVDWHAEGSSTPLAEAENMQNGTTYYGEINGSPALVWSLQLWWDDATFGASAITFETTNRGRSSSIIGNASLKKVNVWDASTSGQKWYSETTLGSDSVSAGGVGGRMYHLNATGNARTRVKIVCNGTGRPFGLTHRKE